MESIQGRLDNLKEMIYRQLGGRHIAGFNSFGSDHGIVGEHSTIVKLPTMNPKNAQDFTTGLFFFMADYDPVDGDDGQLA